MMGVHGLGVMNDNGERFVNACAMNNIVIGGSVFIHKIIHKATWVSPDQGTENRIDHIGINCGVPKKLVNMIKNSYEGKSCRVIYEGQLTKNLG